MSGQPVVFTHEGQNSIQTTIGSEPTPVPVTNGNTVQATDLGSEAFWSFGGEVTLRITDGVAVATLASDIADGAFPWGTEKREHRLNPVLVRALGECLDFVETRSDVEALVVANEGKYWSNGMDLKYMDTKEGSAVSELSGKVNDLLVRLCCFPLPTVAAFSGHWCAAGGMMGLAFDYRVMASDRGVFFVPGVDLGLVYAPVQEELMKAKLPVETHREVIIFNSRRWNGTDLLAKGVVEAAVPAAEVVQRALVLAQDLRPKGRGAARKALGGIKRVVYRQVLEAHESGVDMSFVGRTKGVDRAAPPVGENELEVLVGPRSKL